MPIDRRLDESAGVLWTTMQGDISADDLRGHLDAVKQMDAARYCEIIDTREAIATFGARDLPKLAEHSRVVFADSPMAPRAVVVDRNNLVTFGMARLFASLATPWVTVRVFDSLPGAVAYVDAVIARRT